MSKTSTSGGCEPVLDEAALDRLRELDPTGQSRVLERVFAAFDSSSSRLMQQLADARARGDLGGVRYVAHTLKAASASIGALRLSAVCRQIEQMVDTGATEGLPAQMDAMASEMARVLDHLRSTQPSSP